MVGHSEGGYLAPRIAQSDERVAGLVVLAGNTRPIQDLIVEQVRYLTSLAPDAQAQARTDEALRFKIAVEDPALRPDATIATPGGGTLTGAYLIDLRSYQPATVAAGLACPMLIVRGERDYQVAQADFDGWKGAIGQQPRVTLKQFPGLDHLFVAGTGPSTPAEYEHAGHVDAAVVEDVARWIETAIPRR